MIQESTITEKNLPTTIKKLELNLFLIPASSNGQQTQPDQELAMKLLAAVLTSFSKHAAERASPDFSGPGPYLIALQKPISSYQPDSPVDMLYVDLTNIQDEAFPELVRTFKSRVTDTDVNGIEKLNSVKISLLNAMLIAESSIGFVKAASASLQEAFNQTEK